MTFALIALCVLVFFAQPRARYRAWRRAQEPIRGLAEWTRTRDALRDVTR